MSDIRGINLNCVACIRDTSTSVIVVDERSLSVFLGFQLITVIIYMTLSTINKIRRKIYENNNNPKIETVSSSDESSSSDDSSEISEDEVKQESFEETKIEEDIDDVDGIFFNCYFGARQNSDTNDIEPYFVGSKAVMDRLGYFLGESYSTRQLDEDIIPKVENISVFSNMLNMLNNLNPNPSPFQTLLFNIAEGQIDSIEESLNERALSERKRIMRAQKILRGDEELYSLLKTIQ